MQANGVGKRALRIGTAWTLAAALALACFKSSPSEPIYLWTLGVVALGWGIAASAALAAAGGATSALIDGLARAMGVEMRRASSELLRVDELLAHAAAAAQGKSTCSDLCEDLRRRKQHGY